MQKGLHLESDCQEAFDTNVYSWMKDILGFWMKDILAQNNFYLPLKDYLSHR